MNKKIKGWLDKLGDEIREENWEPDNRWFCLHDLLELGLAPRTASERLKRGYETGELARRKCKVKGKHIGFYTDAKNAPEYTIDKQGK